MPSNGSPDPSTAHQSIGRRRFLAVGAGVTAVSLAGCSTVADFLAGLVLEDVNVINAADHEISGAITITDPDDERVLDEQFDLSPDDDSDDGDVDSESQGVYEDVFTDAGEYAVSVELDDEVDGETEAEETVEVAEPEDEHVIVLIGTEDEEGPILVTVIEEFSDLEELEEFEDAS